MSVQYTKGTSLGVVSIDDKNLCLKYNQSNIIKLPLKQVVNSNTQKNDIVPELSTDYYGDNKLTFISKGIPGQKVSFWEPRHTTKARLKQMCRDKVTFL